MLLCGGGYRLCASCISFEEAASTLLHGPCHKDLPVTFAREALGCKGIKILRCGKQEVVGPNMLDFKQLKKIMDVVPWKERLEE